MVTMEAEGSIKAKRNTTYDCSALLYRLQLGKAERMITGGFYRLSRDRTCGMETYRRIYVRMSSQMTLYMT